MARRMSKLLALLGFTLTFVIAVAFVCSEATAQAPPPPPPKNIYATSVVDLNTILGLVGSSLGFVTNGLTAALIGNGTGIKGDGGLTNLEIAVPISLPLLNLNDLRPSGGWDPTNAEEVLEPDEEPEPEPEP